MRPIDADAICDKLSIRKRQQQSMNTDYLAGYRCALSDVEEMIAEAQTVDIERVEGGQGNEHE